MLSFVEREASSIATYHDVDRTGVLDFVGFVETLELGQLLRAALLVETFAQIWPLEPIWVTHTSEPSEASPWSAASTRRCHETRLSSVLPVRARLWLRNHWI
jgi:hypothetical protein